MQSFLPTEHCAFSMSLYVMYVLALEVFSVAAPTIWNSLPFDIRNSCSIASFRRKLKQEAQLPQRNSASAAHMEGG